MTKRENTSGARRGWLEVVGYLLVFGSVVGIWFGSWHFINTSVQSSVPWLISNEAMRGLFGDQFGAVNSLFSGLAFAGIIVTILLQKRELRLQRQELINSREKFDEQNRTLERQRFENTFFRLLDLHNDITAKLDLPGVDGRKAHEYLYQYLLNQDREFNVYISLQKLTRAQVRRIKTELFVGDLYPALTAADVTTLTEAIANLPGAFDSYLDSDLSMHDAKIKTAYEKACVAHLDDFAHYFRNLYHALRFVDDAIELSSDEKKVYARFLRSQLSDVELISIFYNSLMAYQIPGRSMELGHPKMGRLLVRYEILQNMSAGSLIHHLHKGTFDANNREAR